MRSWICSVERNLLDMRVKDRIPNKMLGRVKKKMDERTDESVLRWYEQNYRHKEWRIIELIKVHMRVSI